MTERLHFYFSLSCIGEGSGNPFQRSCLENPRDRGAWWAAVSGVTQSRTRLSNLAEGASASVTHSPRLLLSFVGQQGGSGGNVCKAGSFPCSVFDHMRKIELSFVILKTVLISSTEKGHHSDC